MNADKDRATKKLTSAGWVPLDDDYKKHEETGLFAPQNPRPSAFICGSLLHGCGLWRRGAPPSRPKVDLRPAEGQRLKFREQFSDHF
jgi:hypothetical protein